MYQTFEFENKLNKPRCCCIANAQTSTLVDLHLKMKRTQYELYKIRKKQNPDASNYSTAVIDIVEQFIEVFGP